MTVRISPFICALRQSDCVALDPKRLPVGVAYTPQPVPSVPRLVRVRDDKPRGPMTPQAGGSTHRPSAF
jgi:hypothetical protein